jgi:hypothetical protein
MTTAPNTNLPDVNDDQPVANPTEPPGLPFSQQKPRVFPVINDRDNNNEDTSETNKPNCRNGCKTPCACADIEKGYFPDCKAPDKDCCCPRLGCKGYKQPESEPTPTPAPVPETPARESKPEVPLYEKRKKGENKVRWSTPDGKPLDFNKENFQDKDGKGKGDKKDGDGDAGAGTGVDSGMAA